MSDGSRYIIIDIVVPDDPSEDDPSEGYATAYMFDSREEGALYVDWKKRIKEEAAHINELLFADTITVGEALPMWNAWLEQCMRFADFFGKVRVPTDVRDAINQTRVDGFALDPIDFGVPGGQSVADTYASRLAAAMGEEAIPDTPIRVPSP